MMSQYFPNVLIGLALAQPVTQEDGLVRLKKDLSAAKAEVTSKLKDDAIWLDPKKEEVLIEFLDRAAVLRPVELAPVLAQNVNFEREFFFGQVPRDLKFPAYNALKAIGTQAVIPILRELRSFDAEDYAVKTPEDGIKKVNEILHLKHRAWKQHKQTMLVHCLIEIYDQGGFGKALARQRIELETEKVTGKEKERLLKALQHPAFK